MREPYFATDAAAYVRGRGICARRALLLCCALLLCLAALLCTMIPAQAEGVIRFVPADQPLPFLDQPDSLWVFCVPIGAQDAYLIVCEGHAMMLDCGAVGRPPNERMLLELLDALGIERFDYVINTHPHTDHYAGFEALLAEVPTGELLTCFPEAYDEHQVELLKAMRRLNVPVRIYTEGEPLTLGGARVDTYRYHDSRNTNDLSLVVRIQYGERSILLTADILLTAQRKMAVEYGELWRSDILKMPHHGIGKPAKAMLEAVQPELCFISNIRNKSSRETWEYLEKRGYPVLYTARQLLALTTDGQEWAVQQWPEDPPALPLERPALP